MKIAEFAYSVDPDEVAHNEPSHMDLYCLPSPLWILNMISLETFFYKKIAGVNFVCLFGSLRVKVAEWKSAFEGPISLWQLKLAAG